MKELNDEELQDMIEKGLLDRSQLDDGGDLKVYSMLFEALEKEPALPLTHNFAGKVTAVIQAKKNRMAEIKLWILMSFIFIVALVAGCFYLSTINTINGSQLVLSLVKYKWVLVFGAAVLAVVQLLDKKLGGGKGLSCFFNRRGEE